MSSEHPCVIDERPELADVAAGLPGAGAHGQGVFDFVGLDGASATTSEAGCYRLDLPAGTVIDVEAPVAQVDEAASRWRTVATRRRDGWQVRHEESCPVGCCPGSIRLDRRRDEPASALARWLEVLGGVSSPGG